MKKVSENFCKVYTKILKSLKVKLLLNKILEFHQRDDLIGISFVQK